MAAGPEPWESHFLVQTPLERDLSRISAIIANEGLASLHWISGTLTQEIGLALRASQPGGSYVDRAVRILVRPGEYHLVEPLTARFECDVRGLRTAGTDSFVIVNQSVVLDVTPMGSDGSAPELTDDPIVVDLYMKLFEKIWSLSSSVSGTQCEPPASGRSGE